MSITALSRSIDRFRKTRRFIYSYFLSQRLCSMPPPLSSSSSPSSIPVLESPNLSLFRSAIPVNVGRSLYCTSAATASSQTSPSKSENTKSSSGDQDSQQDAGKPVRGGPVSWLSFVLLMVTGAGIIFYYDREKKRHIEEINKASKAVKEGPSAGKAAIGGPFNLINHDGKNVTEKDFMGKWTILYFGFTHCPDICPDELQKLAAAVDKIKEKAGLEIVPVFISVDPERDTVEQVREYVKEFHPKLIGLTGNPDEIKKVARAYRVYYMKTAEEDSDYLVDHSIVMYVSASVGHNSHTMQLPLQDRNGASTTNKS